jgi:hypothetical protein
MSKQAKAITNRKNEQLPKTPTGKALTDSDSSRVTGVEDDLDLRDARRALKEAQRKGSIPWEQVKREAGI